MNEPQGVGIQETLKTYLFNKIIWGTFRKCRIWKHHLELTESEFPQADTQNSTFTKAFQVLVII